MWQCLNASSPMENSTEAEQKERINMDDETQCTNCSCNNRQTANPYLYPMSEMSVAQGKMKRTRSNFMVHFCFSVHAKLITHFVHLTAAFDCHCQTNFHILIYVTLVSAHFILRTKREKEKKNTVPGTILRHNCSDVLD